MRCIDPLEDEDKDEEEEQMSPTFNQLPDDLYVFTPSAAN